MRFLSKINDKNNLVTPCMFNSGLRKRINILFIIDVLSGLEGGTERHLYRLVKQMDKDLFSCSIATFDLEGEMKEKMRKKGIDIYHIPLGSIFSLNALRKAVVLRKIMREKKIDIVQTFHFKADTYGVLVSRLSGIKYIVSSRRDTGDTKKSTYILLNKIMDILINRFITVCNKVGERLTKDEGVPISKLLTIYNGIDFNRIAVPDNICTLGIRRKIGISEDDFVVGTVAYFRPEKSYDIFFKAMLLAKKSIKNLKVITVGRGETYDQCRNFCAENNMDDWVIFAGKVDNVSDYIAVMDVGCLVPGSNEGFSNAVLEKMAMGKPLIVTDVGGNAEAVIDGENGIVIPPLDFKCLSEAVIYLHNNPSLRIEMGRKSRERVEKYFSLEKMIKSHENLYLDMLNGGKL